MVTAPSRISVSALVIAPSIYSLSHCHDSYLSPTSLFPLSIARLSFYFSFFHSTCSFGLYTVRLWDLSFLPRLESSTLFPTFSSRALSYAAR